MNIYTKILTLKGSYFVKDYEKTKKNKIQKRPILEATVLKTFKSDEETDTVIEITPNSSKDEIRRYLGEKFVL